jgi:hypothetical protein
MVVIPSGLDWLIGWADWMGWHSEVADFEAKEAVKICKKNIHRALTVLVTVVRGCEPV